MTEIAKYRIEIEVEIQSDPVTDQALRQDLDESITDIIGQYIDRGRAEDGFTINLHRTDCAK